jgi:hypothetical protein
MIPRQPTILACAPVAGEAGGRGESSCSAPRIAPSTPGEGRCGGLGRRDTLFVVWMTVWPAGSQPCCLTAPASGGGCNEPRWCQGAPPRYKRGGPHAMVVSSELMVVSSKLM